MFLQVSNDTCKKITKIEDNLTDDRWKRPSHIQGFPYSSVDKESACNVGDLGSIPGLGKSLGGGHGNPLWYSCLEKRLVGYPMWLQRLSD